MLGQAHIFLRDERGGEGKRRLFQREVCFLFFFREDYV